MFHLVSSTFVVKMAHRKLITVDVMSFPKEKIKAQFQSRSDNLVEYHVLNRRFNYQSDTNLNIP